MTMPQTFTLTPRVSEDEECVDIEMRSETEKYTVAHNVDERFAPLFLAAPGLREINADLLATLEAIQIRAHREAAGNNGAWHDISEFARKAIAKAKTPSP
jgi:hypothetical protein